MTYNDIMTSDNFETDYYKGWLIIYDKVIKKNYPVQLIDTKTKETLQESISKNVLFHMAMIELATHLKNFMQS